MLYMNDELDLVPVDYDVTELKWLTNPSGTTLTVQDRYDETRVWHAYANELVAETVYDLNILAIISPKESTR